MMNSRLMNNKDVQGGKVFESIDVARYYTTAKQPHCMSLQFGNWPSSDKWESPQHIKPEDSLNY